MTVHPGNRECRCAPVNLAEAVACRIAMPYQCRNGGCGVCKGTILQGEVRHAPYQPTFLSEDERMLGRALLCVCTPVTDVEVEYEDAGAERDAVTQTFDVEVLSMQRAAEEVMIVRLGLPEGARMPYRAGQYFDIVLEMGRRASRSPRRRRD